MKSLLGKLFGESEAEQLATENKQLRERQFKQVEYIRSKTNQLLMLMGTLPIRPDEFDDDNLIESDPIGTIANAFVQVLEHQQELNEQLRTAHDEIRAILSSVGIGILVLDSGMRIKMYNQKIIELFFLPEQDLIGRTCSQALCGMPILPANCTFGRIMETKRPFHQTNWTQAGRHFEVAGVPIKNRFGDITQVVMAYTDITRRVEVENRLREREQMCFDVFENARDMVQSVLPDGSFLFVNRCWRETLGYSPDETAGLKIWNIIAPESREECLEHFNNLLHGKQVEQIRTTFFSKDGAEIPVEGRVSCTFSDDKPVATFGLFHPLESEQGRSEAK